MNFIKNRSELERDYLHRIALDVIEYGLESADPYNAVLSSISVRDNTIYIKNLEIKIFGRIHVVGFGKASKRMTNALYDVLSERIVGGIVISPEDPSIVGPVEVVKGDHPIPGNNTLRSSQKLLEYLQNNVGENDVVFILISGGGSALFEVPEHNITLDDVGKLTKELMRRGADIFELNAVRKRFSRVKGGKLLNYVKAKTTVSIIVSDVVGDRLDTIASGPTAPDETTYKDVYNILTRRRLWDEIPDRMRSIIEAGLRGELLDTPKPGDPIFSRVHNVVVASNAIALESMARKIEGYGFKPLILTSMIEGEAREIGKVLASIIKSIILYSKPIQKPAALLAGGETVVTVKGDGIGGRNQELCLSLAASIRGLETVAVCIGTDGIDGVSPAAGAVVDGSTVDEGYEAGLDPARYLENNDSYGYFSKIGRAIITGYTGTNVNDVFLALIK
ncbi:MAG: glycerate kinase [Ignisphaera sp.]|nr:glycerate kinase [Ignisphaera sp.]MCX8167712.1 glycerate kinase [Ignisphaera sp.]